VGYADLSLADVKLHPHSGQKYGSFLWVYIKSMPRRELGSDRKAV